jgi:hypothetical protein
MNSILKTMVFLLIYIAFTILCVFLIGDNPRGAEMPLVIIMYSFYLAPFLCVIFFCTCLLWNKKWKSENKIGTVVFATLLIAWAIYIFVYLHSLIGP